MSRSTRNTGRTLLTVAMVVCLVLWAPVTVVGVGAAQQEGDQPSTPASYYGNVTIDGEPAPAGTEIEAVVDGELKGNITIGEAGEYGGPDALDEKLLVSNATNGSEVRFFADNENIERTEATRTTPSPVEWEAGDVQRVDLQFASGSGLFEAQIDDVDDSVVAGESITLEATVENIAENTDTQTVNITLDGEVVAQREPTLASNETANITEVIATDAENVGEAEVAVETVDDRASDTVTVQAPAEFNVTKLETSNVGDAGESFGANLTVENGGDVAGEQNVTVTFDGETVYDQAVELDADESKDIDVPIDTELGQSGERDVIARTNDDRNITTVDLSAPAFFAVDVIEFDSDSEIVAGQNITVVAEIENTGNSTATQDIKITNNGSRVRTVRGVKLNASESEIIDLEIETTTGDDPFVDVGVESDDDSDSLSVTVREAADPTYEVDITSVSGSVAEPASDGGKTIDVTVDVENIGGQDGEQDIEFAVDGEIRATNEGVSINGGNTKTISQSVDLKPGDAPAVDVSVSSDNATDTQTVDVRPLPEFDIVDFEVPGRVNETEEFTPNVTVENVGEQEADATVGIFFNATSVNVSDPVTLSAGETVEVNSTTLNASELGIEDGTTTQVEANVTNDRTDEVDDIDTSRVSVSETEPANFTVNSLSLSGDVSNGEVVAGETVDIDATIENGGEETGNQTVVLEFGGTEIAAEDVTLDGGNTTTVETSYSAQSGDIGSGVSVSANTDDDTASDTIDVLEPAAFDVEIVAIDDSVIAGETLDVDVRVRNTGEATSTTDVDVFLNGIEANETATLDGGESTIESFDFQPTEDDVGELDVVAVTDDEIDTETVAVGEPGEFDVSFASVPSEITDEESFNATVRVENVGDGEATETIALSATGLDDSKAVTLDGGEVQRVELSDANVPSNGTTVTVQAESASDSTDERDVDIVEAPDPPTFALSAPEAPATVLEPEESTNVTVNTTVTNVGDNQGTQDIELLVDDDEVNSTEVSDLGGGNSEDVSLSFEVTSSDVGTLDLELSSDNRTATATLVVEEAVPAELDITDIADAESVSAGDAFSVNVTVENVGDRDADNGTVTLESPTGTTTEVDAQPSAGETNTSEVSVDISDRPRAGEFDREFTVTAETDGGTDDERTLSETINYGSVRSGVAQAQAASADTVLIAPGTYNERDTVTVETSDLVLEAAGSDPATIAPTNDQTAVNIRADNVTLQGLNFEGDGNESAVTTEADATLESVDVENWETGIESSDGTLSVRDARIENVATGLETNSSDQTDVNFTTVRASDIGVRVTAPNALIADSSIIGAGTGIDVVEVDVSNVEVRRTTIRQNTLGLRVFKTGENDDDPFMPLNSNNLESNGLSVLADDSKVDANDNWWGQPGAVPPGATLARSTIATDPRQSRVASDLEVGLGSVSGGTLERGESYTVPVNVENTGTKGDTQQVELTVAGGPDPASQDATVAAGDTETVTFTLNVDRRFSDSVTLSADSLDDSTSQGYNVVESDSIDLSLDSDEIATDETTTATVEETLVGGTTVTNDITSEATITSADQGIATVDGSTIEAQSTGTATIEAEFTTPLGGTLTDSVELTVVEAEQEDEEEEDEEEDEEDEEDTTDGGGGGGGGGGGIGIAPPEETPTPDVGVIAEETVTPSVTEPGSATVAFSEESGVESVAFESEDVSGSVTARTLETEPDSTGPSPGASAAVTQINVPEGAEDTPATVRMRASRDRIDELDADPADLRVNRFNEDAGEWQGLPSEVVEQNDEVVVLEAETPGFSYFSVSAVGEPEAVIDVPEEIGAGTEITLDGSGSTTEYGEIVAYEWSVNGDSLDGETVTTALDSAGEYEIELTVENDAEETDTVTQTVTVSEAEAGDGDGDGATDGEDSGDDGESTTGDGDEPTDEPAELPGFGVGIALIALLAAALVARRTSS